MMFENSAVRHIASSIGTISVILGALWFVAEPKAEQYVKEIMLAGDYAKSKEVRELNRNIEKTEQRIRELQSKSDSAQTELRNIKELAKEQRDLSTRILLQLQNQSRN